LTITRELLTHATDAELIAGAAAEMQIMLEVGNVMQLFLRPDSVMSLVAMLQLALRKPDLEVVAAPAVAEMFIAGARAYFANAPHVLEMIRRGAAHDYDR
jgi:hypothetical protein